MAPRAVGPVMLLLPTNRLAERREAVAGPLLPLATSLRADLESWLNAPLHPLPAKARMTRVGGQCARCGSALDFDPWAEGVHRCPRCGDVNRGEAHEQWWATYAQLWNAERLVHAAALHLLTGERSLAARCDQGLESIAGRYLGYANLDNVLGPSRPFFSTYLESIWLLQISVALSLREASDSASTIGARMRDVVIAPSAALIASFDEDGSNRQVWNNAALLAAGTLLGDVTMRERAVLGPSGLERHLTTELLDDGTWYEGENYHLFAHRGLWYGVAIAEQSGIELSPTAQRRFADGFAAPFHSALPDFTFPSRRDSQYAVSMRQWRTAESCELGLARTATDDRLRGALFTLYDPHVAPGDTGRARSAAEAERNAPSVRLTRADLGWRSLLHAIPDPGDLEDAAPPRSVLLAGQGLAVLRRDQGRVYVALDYGASGGGHGHPDRLNLLLIEGEHRWLDDMGTGSYVERTLHWYRSTLAHNAPLANERSQQGGDGELLAFEDRGGAGWAQARFDGLAPGVVATRTLVVMPDYLLDVFEWTATADEIVDLPIHFAGEPLKSASFAPGHFSPRKGGLEDGFDFVERASALRAGDEPLCLRSVDGDASCVAWIIRDREAEVLQLVAPGAPRSVEPSPFVLVRRHGRSGRQVTLFDWRGSVRDVSDVAGVVSVAIADAGAHAHSPCSEGWHVELRAGDARSSIDLGGLVPERRPVVSVPAAPADARAGAVRIPLAMFADDPLPDLLDGSSQALVRHLGEAHYRRSEPTWTEAGSPQATVGIAASRLSLHLSVRVRKSHLCLVPPGASNPLDNEPAEVNGDGVQLHIMTSRESGAQEHAWLLMPEVDGPVRVHSRSVITARARWAVIDGGYEVHAAISRHDVGLADDVPFAVDVIVNEGAAGRERRQGQLVLSGGRDDFVYLRGDRQAKSSLIPAIVVHD